MEKLRIEKIKKSLPETPREKIKKLVKKYKIKEKYAKILTKNLDIVEFFEKVIEKTNPKLAVRWITGELLSVLNYNKKELEDTNIKVEGFIELLKNIENEVITELNAKDILRSWVKKTHVTWKLQFKDIIKISSKKEIEKIVKKVLKENQKAIEDYKSGKKESVNFLLGQVMNCSKKRADYKTAREILEKLLK